MPAAPGIAAPPRSHWKETVPTPSASTSAVAAAERVSPRRSVVVPREALVRLLIVRVPEKASLTLRIEEVGALVADSVVPPPSVCRARTLIAAPTSACVRT